MLSALYYLLLVLLCTLFMILSALALVVCYPFDRGRRTVHELSRILVRIFYYIPLNFRWVSKREVFKTPFFGQFLLLHGDICIDRGHAAEALEQLVRDGKKWISRGASVAIFPEGTRSKDPDGKMLPPIREPESRKALWDGIRSKIPEIYLNGNWEHRSPHNLNVSFAYIEGESLMLALKDIAVSSGSACTSASLEPSYVLRALGRDDELAHSSIRFTLGRFTTEEEIDFAIKTLTENVAKLREMSPLWEMHQEGVDLSKIEWANH